VFQYVSDEEAAKEQKRREAGDKQPPATKAAAPGKTQSSVAPLRRDQSWLPLDHEAKSDFGLRLESSQLDQMFHRPKEAI
jgi:hypothetical protein